ncbi:Stk1 family PASTA domain-containing Ser/Thr kinase [Streptomyces sp. NPDC088337]|uniref:Stk1 family PASTA domain-containing Ser/Thr kinase n=1 Tax=unclassified Streptomyces TaxID=2593676 RepID=UPI002DDBB44D|nr:Stk1 family PASTA domain-containing Ser/Thr kinase [Streptomyces sp. NBC_01788]WSB27707.1 Stk1 family PASTA domain-containing Ser/Thr kinase [Streptomyces sp. NBC_01788]
MEEPRRLGGRYELGHVLGRGGMAEVYLAHDTRLGRTVAVKTLRADMARDPSFQARFRREAQSAASLNHPAIVAVYDTGEDYIDGVSIPYIVMEYVDGSTLRELLHSGRKLLPERSMEMTIGILQGLEYAHRSGIVHRDIKPANVMLTRNGQVKVMDFGIARAMGDSGMTMTQTAAVIGTAQYLSPEQAKGEQVDARSDLYSTGCLLYELLTVRPPFVGDSPVAVAYQHVREEAQPPSVFDPEITPEMDAIVMRALVKDPDYRYQSADEMRADIEACLDGQPVAATAAMGAVGYGGYPDDQPTTALRSDAGAAGATTMLPPMNPDDGGYGYDDRPDRRRQKKSNTSTIMLIVAGLLVLVGAIFIGMYAFSGNGVNNDELNVPIFVGQTKREAQESARNASIEVAFTQDTCDDQPKGKVCSQEPKDGKVKKGDTVNLVLSTGAPKVTVPSVRGLSFEAAQSQLDDLGFKVEKKTQESDQDPDVVIDQDVKGDTKVEKGSTITLTVATEKRQVAVPDVSGKTCQEAQQVLQGVNLNSSCSEVPTDDPNRDGKVVQTDPGIGQQVDKGANVNIQVGKFQQQKKQVPNVRGRTVAEARQILAAEGFTNVQFADGSNQDDNSVVFKQDPGEGQEVDDPGNTPITLTTFGGGNNRGNGGFFGG